MRLIFCHIRTKDVELEGMNTLSDSIVVEVLLGFPISSPHWVAVVHVVRAFDRMIGELELVGDEILFGCPCLGSQHPWWDGQVLVGRFERGSSCCSWISF